MQQADEDRKIKEKIKREEVDLRKKREENARIESEERRLKLQLREEQLKQLVRTTSALSACETTWWYLCQGTIYVVVFLFHDTGTVQGKVFRRSTKDSCEKKEA